MRFGNNMPLPMPHANSALLEMVSPTLCVKPNHPMLRVMPNHAPSARERQAMAAYARANDRKLGRQKSGGRAGGADAMRARKLRLLELEVKCHQVSESDPKRRLERMEARLKGKA